MKKKTVNTIVNNSESASLIRFSEDLALLPLAPRTQESYLAQVRHLGNFFQSCPSTLGTEDLRRYFLHLKQEGGYAEMTINQAFPAIKLYWEKTLARVI